jgi:hypothetical protein
LTLHLHEPYLTQPGGYGHDQARVVDHDRNSRVPRLGLWRGALGPLYRVAAAWGALLLSGLSLSLTGQLDWGGLYGERAVFAVALGAAGFALWCLGERTNNERHACWMTLASSLVALALFPAGSRIEFNSGVWLVHLGLCWQLVAWAMAARKAQARGLWIMAGGIATEAFVAMPLAQFVDMESACATGTRMACLYGAYGAMALPAAVTLALIVLWLNPIETALRKR